MKAARLGATVLHKLQLWVIGAGVFRFLPSWEDFRELLERAKLCPFSLGERF